MLQSSRFRPYSCRRTHSKALRLEAITHNLGHLVVDTRFLPRIGDGDDQRERLRLEGFFILDTVPRKKANHETPAFAAFAALAEIAVIRPDGRPLPEFL